MNLQQILGLQDILLPDNKNFTLVKSSKKRSTNNRFLNCNIGWSRQIFPINTIGCSIRRRGRSITL